MQSNKEEKPLIARMNDKLPKLSATETQHSIYRVHKPLRNVNGKAYEPQIIAIGPYHRSKHTLRKMEKYKWRYLQLLLAHKRMDLDTCLSTIGQLEQQARDCYVEPIPLDKDEFVEMLVLDGCFIIELVRKFSSQDLNCENDPIFQMRWMMSSLQRDLILFENQIPFFVLCKLFDLIEGPEKHQTLIIRFLSFCSILHPRSRHGEQSPRLENTKHLLHLVYDSYVSSMDVVSIPMKSGESVHLKRESRFIHCATKLKDANVKFEIKKEYNAVFAVEFKDGIMLFRDGKMQMPPLTIEDRTECLFRNLIAYEQYFPNDCGNAITDYVTFLACLINSSRDVEILAEEGIIDNWLGDDKAVASMLNRLTISINGRDNKFCHAGMFDKINSHYKSHWNRSMAMLWGKVLYSPWTKISFAAAATLLALTITQTVFSILQVV